MKMSRAATPPTADPSRPLSVESSTVPWVLLYAPPWGASVVTRSTSPAPASTMAYPLK